jgi:hypothetical protein
MTLRVATFAVVLAAGSAAAQDAFINEFHYDNAGTDTGEFVEVAVPDGVDVADLVLSLYNGNNASVYASYSGGGFAVGETDGGVTLYVQSFPSNAIQNGSPDGMALSRADGTLLQFLSYEGTFTAVGGPADGVESVDVGAAESGDTSPGLSIQLVGEGAALGDFTWIGPAVESPGAPNVGQTFVLPRPILSIADARGAAPVDTVRVQGVVTRAQGAHAAIQDTTGGLFIRQSSGAFFEAVATGSIAPGTVVEVIGRVSEFSNLLRIDGADLLQFEVIGAEPVPAPQVVTLSDLAFDGEAYEGELVTVRDVAIAPDGSDGGTEPDGTFQPGSTYALDDGTASPGAVLLRIPDAGDTTADGVVIPDRIDLTGVVGQAVNRQVVAFRSEDVGGPLVATEGEPAVDVAVAVENPVRGRATVRFVAPSSRVSLVLFDVLGRRVRTLANGPLGADAQTATLDATGLSAGVYILRLVVGSRVESRTVTVVR